MEGSAIFLNYVFPTVGSILGYIMCLSPLKAVQRADKTGKLGNLNPIPACVFLCNCVVWLMYGAAVKDPFIFVANGPGIPVNLYIIMTTYSLADKELRATMQKTVVGSSILALIIGMVYVFAPRSDWAVEFNGLLAMVINIGLYASPLSSLGLVCKTKSSASIFLPWTLTALGCSITWFIYGMATRQAPVIVPNLLGVILNIVQLVLRCMFPLRSSMSSQGREGSEDGQDDDEQEEQSVAMSDLEASIELPNASRSPVRKPKALPVQVA